MPYVFINGQQIDTADLMKMMKTSKNTSDTHITPPVKARINNTPDIIPTPQTVRKLKPILKKKLQSPSQPPPQVSQEIVPVSKLEDGKIAMIEDNEDNDDNEEIDIDGIMEGDKEQTGGKSEDTNGIFDIIPKETLILFAVAQARISARLNRYCPLIR